MFDFLFNPNGRISRKGYLIGFALPYLIATVLLPIFFGAVAGGGAVVALLALFFLWPSLVSVPIRRFHDMGVSGWFQAGVVGLMAVASFIGASATGPALQEAITSAQANGTSIGFAELVELQAKLTADSPRAMLGQGLVYLVQFAQFLLFALRTGETGANRFGNDPLVSGRGFAD